MEETLVQVLGLVALAAFVAGVAGRFSLSAPLLLTAVGIVASYIPGVPAYELDPDLVLFALLPPLLYATAIRTPWVDLRRNRRSILFLSVALVLVTAFTVAVVAQWVIPSMPFAAAFALGAVVAPPDAIAASAVARKVGMPRSVVTLLEGESLLNDATALVTLRTAVAAVGVSVSLLHSTGEFLVVVTIGVAVGIAVAALGLAIRKVVSEPVLDTALSLIVPFFAYLTAEELHGSGVLAVVIAGLALGNRSLETQSPVARITERVVWRSISFLLESVVFLLIGLQLRRLIEDVDTSAVSNLSSLWLCLAVLATVIVTRLVWVFPVAYLPFVLPKVRATEPKPSWRDVTLIGWAGMRGVVTLAAALSLPSDFPARPALVLAAFTVVAGTLLLQGSTLPWLVRRLRVRGPDPAEDALAQALVVERAVSAGQEWLDDNARPDDPPDSVEELRRWSTRMSLAQWERLGSSAMRRETPAEVWRRLRSGMLAAERAVVLDLRRQGTVPHEVVEEVLERFDQEDAMISRFGRSVTIDPDRLVVGDVLVNEGGCVHLRDAAMGVVPRTPGACEACVAVGRDDWVHLRMCLTCGTVGCCNSSPLKHADEHFQQAAHPVMRSLELGEAWRWCYVDEVLG